MTTAPGIVVGRVADIPDGEAIRLDAAVAGTLDAIAVFNDGGEIFALDDTCSHERASLADGWVEDGIVECPLHAGTFCLRDGSVRSMPATRGVTSHRVEVSDGVIVLFPAPGSTAP